MTARLVYGHAWLHDCLAFANGDTAHAEANEIVAIATARTFGEAAGITTVHVSNPAVDTVEDGAVEPDEPMNILRCYGVEDGDWPPMVTSRALRLLPAAIREEFGTVQTTIYNGDYLEVPLAAERGVVEALTKAGFEVFRNDNLINVLDGRTVQPVDYDDPSRVAVWPLNSD
ncbi:MAG TPA: hypothetical protein VHA79_09250 [Mycobacteriales bacterium]|nr:hypothetical protein [Mycobacteriales bacterium]